MTEEQIKILRHELDKNTRMLQEKLNDLQRAYDKPKQLEQEQKQDEVNKGLANMRPVVGNNGDARSTGYSQSFYDDLV